MRLEDTVAIVTGGGTGHGARPLHETTDLAWRP